MNARRRDAAASGSAGPLRLGSRGSTLALIQSGLIADALRASGAEVEIVRVVTSGDVRPPDTAWGEGAFVTALEEALLDGRVDLAVHSAKDVPIAPEERLAIAAYPPRVDPRDALVRRAGEAVASLDELPEGAVVGTDSPRRTGFLLAARPDLRLRPLHGNVDTRLRRLDEGEVDALVLAIAGLTRLGRADRITLVLDPAIDPPAPGQGALAVQVRSDDERARRLVARLDDPATRLAVTVERALLEAFGGGCRAPVGALARASEGAVELIAAAVEPDGTNLRTARWLGPVEGAVDAARSAGLDLGAARPSRVEAAR